MALNRATVPQEVEKDLDLRLVRKAFAIRLFEERLLELFSQGKLFGTVHTCIGQEWTGIAVAEHLKPGDVVFSNHRCHGHYLAKTENYRGLLAEIMGRESGICAGRGGSQHICDTDFYSNGIQGGIVPIAAGIAMALKISGNENIAIVYIGDGTLGEGVVYETLNLSSLWSLPLLIVLENNLYAQSTPQRMNLAGSIQKRAESFGVHAECANTWDVGNLLNRVGNAISLVRNSRRPVFLEIETYRLMAHSKGDDDRDPDEVRRFCEKDTLTLFDREHVAESERIRNDIRRQLDEAVFDAEASAFTKPLTESKDQELRISWSKTEIRNSDRVVNRIYAGLRASLDNDPRVILLGEDIEGPYGGAFKVTKDLSQLFPGRVKNTPISEAAILGLSIGLALQGLRPICEFMFGDFLLLAADQFVNHAAKFRYIYNDKVLVPVIVRTPMGGRRGYGATHSQSLEKHFFGVPGTRVLALHHRFDPAIIYEDLVKTVDRPTLVIENKLLYGERITSESPKGFVWLHADEPFPVSYLKASGPPDLTFLCYGGILLEVEKAVQILFDEHDLISEVICPTQLYPLPIETILSCLVSGRLIVVEEGQEFCGLGAEISARLQERQNHDRIRVNRIAAAEQPIPSCKRLEMQVLPGVEMIVSRTLDYLRA